MGALGTSQLRFFFFGRPGLRHFGGGRVGQAPPHRPLCFLKRLCRFHVPVASLPDDGQIGFGSCARTVAMLDDPSPGEVDSGADLLSQLLRHAMFVILGNPLAAQKPYKNRKPFTSIKALSYTFRAPLARDACNTSGSCPPWCRGRHRSAPGDGSLARIAARSVGSAPRKVK